MSSPTSPSTGADRPLIAARCTSGHTCRSRSPTGQAATPRERAELADSLTFAFLVLLDELDPTERAVLLLHDVFGHNFDEVAAVVGKSSAVCRQIASRTRKQLDARSVELRRPSDSHEHQVLTQLAVALLEGDLEGVMALMSPDVVQTDDGGPDRHAARRPIIGPERIARFLINLAKRIPEGATVDFEQLNSTAAIVTRLDGAVFNVMMFEFAPDGRIRRIWDIVNPDKLRHLH